MEPLFRNRQSDFLARCSERNWTSRNQGFPGGNGGALAAAGPHPGRRWKPSEMASIRAIYTAWPGPLRVRYGDSANPRFAPPQAVRRAGRRAAWHS